MMTWGLFSEQNERLMTSVCFESSLNLLNSRTRNRSCHNLVVLSQLAKLRLRLQVCRNLISVRKYVDAIGRLLRETNIVANCSTKLVACLLCVHIGDNIPCVWGSKGSQKAMSNGRKATTLVRAPSVRVHLKSTPFQKCIRIGKLHDFFYVRVITH